LAPTIFNRFANAFNAFRDRDPTTQIAYDIGPGYSSRPDKLRWNHGNERSIVSSVYTRIGIDASSIGLQHVRLDQNGRLVGLIDSGLNNCLTLEANIDQTGRAFLRDVVISMCDEGVVAIVPVDTTGDPDISGSYDVLSMRTAKIVQWFPYHIQVELYNERTGQKELITLAKKNVAIVENPLYSVMNEPNSTLRRLVSKLNLLDAIDNQSGSGKLDLIIQLPYVIKTAARKEQAEIRRKDIEAQLIDSKYGIAYTDATEKVTQLNRPAENNLMKQIEFLTSMLNSQLGLTPSIYDGTADEKIMNNYHNRTVGPILDAVADAMRRTFLTKTGRSQGQSVAYFRNPFSLVPASELGVIADALSRNGILTPNEFRTIFGYMPSNEADAESLRNKNIRPGTTSNTPALPTGPTLLGSTNQQGDTNGDFRL
jgi:Phage portal protein